METWVDNAWIMSLISASLCFTAAIQLWRYRDSWQVKSILVMTLSLFLWALGYGLALRVSTVGAKLWWAGVELTGVAAIPAGLVMLALSYSRRASLLKRKVLPWIFLLPAITAILSWTNPYHHLIFGPFESAQGGDMLRPDFRIGFWVLYFIYPYLVSTVCVLSMFVSFFHKTGREKRELLFILLSFSLPTLLVFYYHTHLVNLHVPDPTTSSFAVVAIFNFYAIFRYRSPQTSAMEASDKSTELNFKVHVVRALTMVLIPALTYFIAVNFSAGWIFAGTINILFLCTIIFSAVLIVNSSSVRTIDYLFRAAMIVFVGLLWTLCIYFLSYDISSGTILWSLAMPLVCILAFGSNWGLVLSLVYQAVSMMVSLHMGNFDTVYFSSFGIRYTVVYLILAISLFYMDKKRLEFLRQTTSQRDSLLESDRRYRWATESGSVGVWEMDTAGHEMHMDRNIFKMLGSPNGSELSGLTQLLDLCPEDYRRQAHRNWRALSHGSVAQASFEMPLLHREGDVRWFLIRGQMLEGLGEHQGSVYGTITDITERKRAEEDKTRLESQLRHSQKMEAVGTLAGGIAHEFNNLLAAIMGYAELAQDDAQGQPKVQENLDEIVVASLRAKDLIGQLLTFSRKGVPQVRPLEINNEILTGQKMLQRLLPRTVEFVTHLAPELKMIEASASHINQLLVNLVSNAAHAMPEGGRLDISTANVSVSEMLCPTCGEAMHGQYVLLKVSDTGHGMDQVTLRRILEPFFTTKEVGSGTGLGLSVVHGIIRSYQGHIICESQEGKGTTIQVYLPAYQGGAQLPELGEGDDGPLPGGDETILLVDDEAVLCEMGRRTLDVAGYQVFTAGSGEAALELFAEYAQSIDLVVLDLGMPGMGGQKCLNALRELKPELKVIVLSGYTSGDHRKTALQAGAAAFLNKPTPKAELLRTVRAVLDA
ncbi:MAG: response regulator [Desulfarculaceae bacterium]|nr:response regulator [Desulfarculaceae bacterium]MCF8047455.1 response regulator [Desulfarculaceae bacterium]MCF8064194.1 response regulator [Desulfarculaceae bacterium]MCF8098089.1 response regulator [Desulfarculaceae bacterium]MCF8123838.1 response regulator [Desulfarculaceae bacterium]